MIMPEPGTGGGISGVEFLSQVGVTLYFFVYSGDPNLNPGDSFLFTSSSGFAEDAAYNGEYIVSAVVYQSAQDRWRITTTTIGTAVRSGS